MASFDTPTVQRVVVQAFPFHRLASVTRAEADAIRRTKRFARARLDATKLADALPSVLGATATGAQFRVTAIRRAELRGADDAIGVLVAVPGETSTHARALVEIDGALAARIVSSVIQQKAPAVADPGRLAHPAIAGATAAVVVAILRKVTNATPVQAVAAGPAHAIARDFAASLASQAAAPAYLQPRAPSAPSAVPAITVWIAATLANETFGLRVTIPDDANIDDTRDAAAVLSELGATRIAIPAVFATCAVTIAELDAMQVGDAFMPPKLALDGPIALVPPRGERGFGGNFAENARLVIGGVEEHPWVMPESPESRTDIVVDAPVVVRVELGSVEMPARSWSELGPGDVIALNRKIGDPAILRVGGVEVARGELVQIDGEYGVRITSRTKEGT